MRSHWFRDYSGSWIGAVLSTAAGLLLYWLHLGDPIERWSYDLPFHFRSDRPTDAAVIVYVDEESYNVLGQVYGVAWSRRLHAKLIRRLTEEGARLIVMDIWFEAPGDEEATRELASAMRHHGNVIIGAELLPAGSEGLAQGWRLAMPLETLASAAKGVALVKMLVDPDYGIRQQFPGFSEGETFMPSLAWKAAQLAGAPLALHPKDAGRHRWINYYGPPGAPNSNNSVIPNLSYHLALQDPPGFPPGFFKDKVVFIGQAPISTGFAGESKDEFRTPYTWWTGAFASGVEIHATAFLNLLHDEWLSRPSRMVEVGILVLTGILLGAGLARCPPLAALLIAPALLALIIFASVFLVWKGQVWFPWLIVAVVQLPMAFTWSLVFNSMQLYVAKKLLEQSLSFHLSPARVKQIEKRRDLLKPGAERQEISILFSDIANFSKITGRMEPEDLFRLLNRYFETSLGCIHANDGTVVKLIGDAIFAIWNAPFPQSNHQERACRAALLLRDQLVQFDATHKTLPLKTRVGLHTGFAYVGNVGSSSRFDYTAIGDHVNLASRLEGLNKYLGTDILATRDLQKIVEKAIRARLLGHFQFKGFDRFVEVHEIVNTIDRAPDLAPWEHSFGEALHLFQRGIFDGAEKLFHQTLQAKPEDGPSLFYLEQISRFRIEKPPADWAGEIEIKEK